MITIEKLKEYEAYHGYYDGFYIQKVKNKSNINNDEDWYQIDKLLQDIKLINKNLTSKDYAEENNIKILQYCENTETIAYLRQLAEKDWV